MQATPTFAGIDWSWQHHALCIVDDAGHRLEQLIVPHSKAGLTRIAAVLRQHAITGVGIERGDGPMVEHLLRERFEVVVISPRQVKSLRARYGSAGNKDDRFDAFVLADTLRHEHAHWRPLTIPSPLLAELKVLTRDRERLLETQQATEHQLRMILEAYHPAAVRLFSSVDRQITLSFVTDYPTPAIASRVKTARMAGFLSRHHYTGRVRAQVLAERMRANLLTASAGTVSGKSFSAQAFARLLSQLNTMLAEYDDAIAAAVAEHPDSPIFASFPGIGPTLTAVLLAEIGEDRSRYPNSAILLAEAGLAPVTRSSGRSSSVRFRYAANRHLREAAMWWAFNSLKESPWAADAFRQARDQRGQRYHRALRGLSARWMRILWRCWTDSTPYDPAQHGQQR